MTASFGVMLMDRRRQLGLSIQQVANTIKIRPQIIEYFETENYAAMPSRGYAQGMISSYARYLGLNPREVIDAYFDGLSRSEQALSGARALRETAAGDASPRSANAQGRYMMLDAVPASSRFASRPMQAGYVPESRSSHEPLSTSRLRSQAGSPRGGRPGLPGAGGDRWDDRPYRGRDGYEPGAPQRTQSIPLRGSSAPSRRGDARAGYRSGYRSGDPRRSAPARGGYGSAPRDGYRGGSRMPPRGGQGRPPYRGASGASASGWPFDPRLMLVAGLVALALIVLVMFTLLRGCAPAPAPAGSDGAPAVQSVDRGSADASGEDDADADAGADAEADAGSDAADAGDETGGEGDASADKKADGEEPKETKVKVSIKGKGTVAWLEVKLDGKSVLASQEVGPFEQEFTVTDQIEITTDKPSDVEVTKNGEKVRYDTKVSGVAKVAIAAPKPDPEEETADEGDANASTDGSDAAAMQ